MISLLIVGFAVALNVMQAAAQVVVTSRTDIVVREVFRCHDSEGPRPFTYHLSRADYGYTLWKLRTQFVIRSNTPYGRQMGPHHAEQLAIIVLYDSRTDGPEDLAVIEGKVRDVLSGARRNIAHDGSVHWGPYTIVQDPDNRRFWMDHRQPYGGGGEGQVEIVIEPYGQKAGGFVRSQGMNLIGDQDQPLTSCVFNTTPVPRLRLD